MNLKIIGFLAIAVIAVFAFGLSQSQEAQVSASKDEPTAVRRGELTDIQKEHSKLYQDAALGKKLTSYEEKEITIYTGSQSGRTGDDPRTPEIRIHRNVCDADIVVVGSVNSKASQLTSEEDYIFTDFTISVVDLLKNDGAYPAKQSGSILVSRPGGSVRFDGKTRAVVNRDELPLNQGTKYLLFLSRIPLTGGYVAKAGSISLEGDGENKVLSQQFRSSDFVGKSTSEILEAVRTAATYGCSKQ